MAMNGQSPHPLIRSHSHGAIDAEANAGRCNRKQKHTIYIAAFAVFQTIVILVFALVFMRVKSPKATFRDVQLGNIVTTSLNTTPSFDIDIAAASIRVKNPNFGNYKYPNATVLFIYKEYVVGTAPLAKRKVGMKSSKTSEVSTALSSDGLQGDVLQAVADDIGLESLVIKVQVELKGKVGLMMGMMKKKKAAKMNCTMVIDLASKTVNSLSC